MKKYGKRCFALLFALLMLSGIRWARATESVYFTAVNETVLELSDATMPFWADGHLYVPASVFANKELGITYSSNTVTRVVTLRNMQGVLQFDLDKGTVTDGQGIARFPAAVVRGGRAFLPVHLVADFYGLTYTNTQVEQGFILRLRSWDSVLNDHLFLDAAISLLEYRYKQYMQEKEVAPPITDPPVVPLPPGSGEMTMYLCFPVTEETPRILETLGESRAFAAFFFTEEQLREDPDLARRTLASGHTVGLTVQPGKTPAETVEKLRTANETLWQLTGWKTRLYMPGTADEATRLAAVEAGYCCLQADVDWSVRKLPEEEAAALLQDVRSIGVDAAAVLLPGLTWAEGVQAFLREAEDVRFLALTETA